MVASLPTHYTRPKRVLGSFAFRTSCFMISPWIPKAFIWCNCKLKIWLCIYWFSIQYFCFSKTKGTHLKDSISCHCSCSLQKNWANLNLKPCQAYSAKLLVILVAVLTTLVFCSQHLLAPKEWVQPTNLLSLFVDPRVHNSNLSFWWIQ